MFCPKCGQKIKDDCKFCAKCGFQLANQTETRRDDGNKPERDKKDRKPPKHCKKRSTVILLIILILLVAGGSFGLSVFLLQSHDEPENNTVIEEMSVQDLCRTYAADYEVIEESTNTIQVEGPDFEKLLKFLSEEETQDISAKTIERLITEHPEAVKKYVFTVAMIDKTEVENAFLDQVAYELMMVSMKDMKIIEEWSSDR